MQLLRSADAPIDRRDHEFSLFQASRFAPAQSSLAAVAFALIVFGRLKNIWIAYYVAGRDHCHFIDFSQSRHGAFPSNQLARAHDRRRAFHKVPLLFELSVFRSRSHRRFHPVLRDQLGKVGKRTSSNTGPRRRQPTRHDDQNAALHRTGSRRQLRATCGRAGW